MPLTHLQRHADGGHANSAVLRRCALCSDETAKRVRLLGSAEELAAGWRHLSCAPRVATEHQQSDGDLAAAGQDGSLPECPTRLTSGCQRDGLTCKYGRHDVTQPVTNTCPCMPSHLMCLASLDEFSSVPRWSRARSTASKSCVPGRTSPLLWTRCSRNCETCCRRGHSSSCTCLDITTPSLFECMLPLGWLVGWLARLPWDPREHLGHGGGDGKGVPAAGWAGLGTSQGGGGASVGRHVCGGHLAA